MIPQYTGRNLDTYSEVLNKSPPPPPPAITVVGKILVPLVFIRNLPHPQLPPHPHLLIIQNSLSKSKKKITEINFPSKWVRSF